jgi:CubicO group peptidase (beta-lactamase class C family)
LSSFAQTDAYEKFVIRFVEHYNSKHFDQVYALTAPGAGGLDASAEGMKKLLSFLTNLDQSLLGKAVNASVETQWKQEQELGTFWVNQTLGNKVAHWHNGQTGGFNAFLGWVEGQPSGVFILSNQSGDVATLLGMAYLEGMGSR